MIRLYVESNFAIQLAMMQEHAPVCTQFLLAAETGSIAIVTPAISLIEPLYNWRGRADELQKSELAMRRTADELARSSAPAERSLEAALRQAAIAESKLSEDRRNRVAETLTRIASVARIIPIDRDILEDAYQQEAKGLAPQDAIVLASVLHDKSNRQGDEAHAFLTFDRKDFICNSLVRTALRAANIKTFSAATAISGWLRGQGVVL